jgi:hypothetical protein
MAIQDPDNGGPADDVSDQSTPEPEWTTTEPGEDRSAYHGDEVLPPPVYTGGRYQYSRVSPPTHPPDPILPFIAPPVPRHRRSDWPVLAMALIVSAVVLAICCMAGYALYASKGPLISWPP